MTTLLGILAFAALFALFGWLRPSGDCGGGCAGCTDACPARMLDTSSEVRHDR